LNYFLSKENIIISKNKKSNRHSISVDKEFLKDIVNKVVKDKIDANNTEELNKQAANVLNELMKMGSLSADSILMTSKFILNNIFY